MGKIWIIPVLASILILGMTSPAFAVTVEFLDFSSTAGLTLNGEAISSVNGIDKPSKIPIEKKYVCFP